MHRHNAIRHILKANGIRSTFVRFSVNREKKVKTNLHLIRMSCVCACMLRINELHTLKRLQTKLAMKINFWTQNEIENPTTGTNRC